MNNILMIKTAALGDVVRTTSFLKGLSSKYGPCSIYWVTNRNALELLEGNKLIDRLFDVDDQEGLAGVTRTHFDLVINLEEKLSTCRLATSCNKKELFGAYFNETKNTVEYTDSSSSWFDMSLISRYGKERADELKQKNTRTYQNIVSECLDIANNRPTVSRNDPIKNEFIKRCAIDKKKHVIGINSGAGRRWSARMWSCEKTAELIDMLNHELNVRVILYGGPGEVERNKRIMELAETEVLDAGCNNALSEFVGLVDVCDVLVTQDTMAMHIAIALQKFVVALFGPTSSAEIDLYNSGSKIIPDLPCLTCYKSDCDKMVKCMDMITVGHVFERLKDRLSDLHKAAKGSEN